MEILHKQLLLRHQRLKQAVEMSKIILHKSRNGGISEEEFTLCRLQLKQKIETFEKTFQQFLTHYGTQIQIDDNFNSDLLNAEDTLTEFDAAAALLKTLTMTVKLPKLNLPKYDGDKLKWHEFWDRFQANVHMQPIAEADKLSYLIGYLEGPALESVAGLTINNANYSIATETLKTRFGSDDQIIDAHYLALNNLPKATRDAHSCRKTLNDIERHLRILEKIGENTNGNHLRGVILGKFPEKIIHQYHLNKNENDTILDIRRSLEKIVTAVQMSQGASFTAECSNTGSLTTEALHVGNPKPTMKGKQMKFQNRKRKGEPITRPDNKRSRLPCVFCHRENHDSTDCRRFRTIEARKKKLGGRCLRCLTRKHKTIQCTKKITCFKCKGDHLQMLCPKTEGEDLSNKILETVCETTYIRSNSFLQTAVTLVLNPNDNEIIKKSRLVLDSGSQRSYITSKLSNNLKLVPTEENLLLVYTFGASSPEEILSPSVDITIKTKRNVTRTITVNVVPYITERLPVIKFSCNNTDLAADDDSVGETISLLIGNDYYTSFMRESKIQIGSLLYVIDSDFGWLLSGKIAQDNQVDKRESALTITTYCHCHNSECPYFTEPDLPLRNIDIKFLWSLECIGITDSPKTTRQDEAVKHFNDTVKYTDGRYEVKWPWIEYPPPLSDNFGLALGRLKSLIKRLDMETLLEYDKILKQQLDSKVIETVKVNDPGIKHPVHYIPHHMVKREGKPGRIVYDAAAKSKGRKSLNECLYSGPSMLEDLSALLLKFRTNVIGLTADVEKAFLQIGLQPEDRDVTRFLWLKDIDEEPTNDNILCLRFCRVPFGMISSPFLLTATIRYHLSQTNKDLLHSIANKCYVDNLVTGASSILEAQRMITETRNTFEQISMNIRDWISNEKEVMKFIPDEQKAKQTETVKILGLLWNTDKDTLRLNVTEDHFNSDAAPNTKRKVLRTMARIYDPCGFICPLILPLKLLFREICEHKFKWDSPLPEGLIQSSREILDKLKTATQVELPRYFGHKITDPNLNYELHCFSDASNNAYAAVIYIRAQSQYKISVSFVMGKSRLAKTEKESELKIPKLELLGFLIASRLLKYVRTNLELSIQREVLWTDSLVVLGWMRSNKLLPPFVSNRVEEIKQNQSDAKLYYVNTKENPADVATRPDSWKQKERLWFNGPEFLSTEESYWPRDRHYEFQKTLISVGRALEQDPEVQQKTNQDPLYKELEENFMELNDQESTTSEADSEQKTTQEIKDLQQLYFADELTGKRTHLAKNLNFFVDKDGLLRCRGRMQNTNWSYDMKYPILLPKDSDLTNEIIKRTHEKNYHVGASHTLSIIRERYWIPHGKSQVQKVIKKCTQCVKHGGGPYRLPSTPALPKERVNYSPPFTFTGLDYFGPLYVKTSTGIERETRWVALFTCLTIRAIHLELVKDLSAEECLLAIRRFMACRNTPKRIYSDNATYFKLVSEVMGSSYCIENKIEWKFIPQLAPWHGGFYERLVALVKHCLKRTLEKHVIHDSKLSTVLKEVEAVVNSRPLTKIDTDVVHILRPSDFLSLGTCLSTTPSTSNAPSEGTATKHDLIGSWKRGLTVLEEFKKMFVNQYLIALRERYQHSPKQPRVRSNRIPGIGDIVQIKTDSKNRETWKVGRIVDLIKGADGECRVAKVKVDDSTFTRSIGHLYPLEDDSAIQATSRQADKTRQPTLNVPIKFLNEDDLKVLEDPNPSMDNGTIEEPVSKPEDKLDGNEIILVEEEENPNHVSSNDDVMVEESERIGSNEGIRQEHAPSTLTDLPKNLDTPTAMKGKRNAAIRAREKILEWTRHLLSILN